MFFLFIVAAVPQPEEQLLLRKLRKKKRKKKPIWVEAWICSEEVTLVAAAVTTKHSYRKTKILAIR